ncbi:MAG: efflux RND transporter periplasmic adaptor subunit [Gammaproteobacteria bacterium]|nr:efflux RND transporter periplasmic adaptor subunit [Gammaproteobacteria bacterium]MCB1852076.1 efflux RND transporter periplasmic adaptor subunit [Gammaproteobacteria bacterium]
MAARLLVLLWVLVIAGCQVDQSNQIVLESVPNTHSLAIARVERQMLPVVYPVPGTVVPKEHLQIASKLHGIIDRIHVDEGDLVDVGDLLVEIDDAQVTAAIKSAEASLSAANTDLKDARDDVKRFRGLARTHALAEDQLRDALVRVAQTEAAVTQDEAQLIAAREERRYTRIITPVRAQVRERLQDTGDLAVAGAPLLRLDVLGAMDLEVFIPASRIDGIHLGQNVDVYLHANDIPLQGQVRSIVYSADKVTRNCKVKIGLPNEDRLMPGQFGRAHIVLGQSSAMLVPAASVTERAGIEGVFIRNDKGTARFRSVRLGKVWRDKREVLAGIEVDDWVLLDPPARLREGDNVKPVSASEQ